MVVLAEMNRMQKDAEQLRQRIERTQSKATRTTVSYDGMPHSKQVRSLVEIGAVQLADLEAAHGDLLEQLAQLRQELSVMVDALPDPDQRAVMRLRYEKGYKPKQIAAGIGVCCRSVFNHMDAGKRELLRRFPDRFRVE